jgi:hypothetical protein
LRDRFNSTAPVHLIPMLMASLSAGWAGRRSLGVAKGMRASVHFSGREPGATQYREAPTRTGSRAAAGTGALLGGQDWDRDTWEPKGDRLAIR